MLGYAAVPSDFFASEPQGAFGLQSLIGRFDELNPWSSQGIHPSFEGHAHARGSGDCTPASHLDVARAVGTLSFAAAYVVGEVVREEVSRITEETQ